MSRFAKLSKAYGTFSVIVVNTLLLAVILNLAAMPWLARWSEGKGKDTINTARWDPVTSHYGIENVRKAYPGLDDETIRDLLYETWSRPLHFEPYTQMKEPPYKGKFINVHQAGFRISKKQAPWPIDQNKYNIFVFGGSTIFGYGLSDEQTLPSQLGQSLPDQVNVYNFARGYYFSTQERLEFERLLMEGAVPKLAIFIDGLNDFYQPDGNPYNTPALVELYSKYQGLEEQRTFTSWWDGLPLVRMVHLLRASGWDTSLRATKKPQQHFDPTAGMNENDKVERVIKRYLDNKRMITATAAQYGVKVLFVWQPVPTYKYDLGFHVFKQQHFGQHRLSEKGYPRMAERISEPAVSESFVWCADVQADKQELLYIDQVHYSPKLISLILDCMRAPLQQVMSST
jgi:hypothetical protein